ncbi:lysophospholipid acyltransferase family protein [Caldimonas sp. KR1-144]|uniref:lysophospholipid acyltransferase family protein n=1 Tax=Caldimonas sp. KR1-144 TaxID=3400911 RepID=UPI003C0023DD
MITGLMKALARWPLPLLHAVGAPLGWLVFAASPSYRRRFRANAEQAGVAWPRARHAVAAGGRLMAELPPLWVPGASAGVLARTRWEDGGLVEAALAAGRGIVFLTPHLGCFEVTAQSFAQNFGARCPITVLYRPARKPWLRDLVEGARRREHLDAAPATLAGVRQMLRALRRGEAVGLLPDQVPPEGLGAWAPFFGKPAYTMTLAARLVQQTGATVLLAWGERLARGRGYVVHVSALAEPLPGAASDPDGSQSAAAINRAMESLILQCPEQYLWGYHRYKAPRALST